MRALILAGALLLGPMILRGQQEGLAEAAERARQAWLAHDAAGLVRSTSRLVLQLPGTDPSTALGPDQAAALLADFLSPTQEVEVEVRAARELEQGRGYVELVRRYRVAGTQDIRAQTLLLGYRRAGGAWELVELRVVR